MKLSKADKMLMDKFDERTSKLEKKLSKADKMLMDKFNERTSKLEEKVNTIEKTMEKKFTQLTYLIIIAFFISPFLPKISTLLFSKI